MKPVVIKHHADGTPYARPYLGINAVTKAPMRPYKRFPEAANDEEAQEMAQEWVNTIAAAADLHVSVKLVEMLARYIDRLEANGKSPNTIKTYRSLLQCYVAPNVGNVGVGELKPYMVDGLYNVILMRESRKGGTISPNTVIKLHWFLSGAYRYFVREGVCEFNPMLSVTKPERDLTEAVAFNESEFNVLSKALAKAVNEPAESREAIFRRNAMFSAYLALWNGERCGEVLANSKADAQLFRQLMHIGNTLVEKKGHLYRKPKPKSKRSRNISIYDDVCANIERHYEWQAEYLPAAKQNDYNRMICCTADGGLMRPSTVSTEFSALLKTLGLPRGTSYHTLRQTHATWMLLQGVDLKNIAERLGHANEATTLSLYAHVRPGRDEMAAAAFAEAAKRMGGAL